MKLHFPHTCLELCAQVLWDDPNNHRHPMDKGIGDVTYCGPHAFPLPVARGG